MSVRISPEIRLEPITAVGFESWAESSRQGFAEQQVGSGAMPAAEAKDYAERSFDELLPEGLGTLGHHIWTVHEADAEVGHLWIRVSEHSDGLDAFVFDIALEPGARGRGIGRATMLAGESRAREMGATRMRLNVFGHNVAATRLYGSLGYEPASTMMARRLETSSPMTYDRGPTVSLVPMTPQQFDPYRARAEKDYATNIADSGMLPPEEARRKSIEDFARLLPDGLDSTEHFFWAAYDNAHRDDHRDDHRDEHRDDQEVGMVWLNIAPKSDGLHAFGYDFSVHEGLRRHGYGRSIMVAAEQICRDRGVISVALNVFGFNVGARALYEQMGFEVSAQLMRKAL